MTEEAGRPVIVTVSDFPSSGSTMTTREIVDLATVADDAGIERFTISDFPFHRDLIPLMTACLAKTSSVTLESLVTSPHYRLPETTACTFATMAELSDYRVILGLGRGGVPLNIPPWGRDRPNAIAAMTEMVVLCRAMWSGAPAPETLVIPSSKMRLNFDIEGPIPILIAAGGRQMLALAARLADIVHIASPFLGRSYLTGLMEHIHAVAAASGRQQGSYEVDLTVPLSVLPDGDRAKRLAKVSAAMGISWMGERARAAPDGAPLPEEFGPAARLIGPITSGWAALGDAPFPDELAELISEDVLSIFSIAGTPDECREELIDLVRALPGATGVRVKLPSLTGEDAPDLYASMIREVGAIAPGIRSARSVSSAA
ncbi:MAG TPA: LLM class flavin-dependent oxidoreductase [Acidimicrobiales bacterium]|jgi:alkanesulfonate monooxygenase SsuD/methylene tetrahydromethanopterin reductase-like flavin-dependent oxidoreductase (luciferase family)|nr:LLM class flavin-dependent oxidoreductase [Acidimicrobiales bacterium]